MGLRDQIAAGIRELASGEAIKDVVTARIPRADLDDRDPDYLREQLPGLWLSYQVPGGVLALVASQLGRPIITRDVRRSLAALKDLIESGGLT
jgi:hypothetical protein